MAVPRAPRTEPTARQQSNDKPRVELKPRSPLQGEPFVVLGAGWRGHAIRLTLDKKPLTGITVLQGTLHGDAITPDESGAFMLSVRLPLLPPGRHTLLAESFGGGASARAAFEVAPRARPLPGRRGGDKPFWRAHDYFIRRFGATGHEPPGLRRQQLKAITALRKERDLLKEKFFKTPFGELPKLYHGGHGGLHPTHGDEWVIVYNGCPLRLSLSRWTPVGPAVVPRGQTAGEPTQPVSGRTIGLAIAPVTDPAAPRTILAGTASGGIWKSTDTGHTWRPTSDDHGSLSVRTFAIDPTDPRRIFAGTGEINIFSGSGLLMSVDGGDHWTPVETDPPFAETGEVITRIMFDPTDPEAKRMFLASTSGAYESTNRGQTWTRRALGFITDFVLIATDGPPRELKLIVAPWGGGLSMNTRRETASGFEWQYGAAVALNGDFPADSLRTALGQCASRPDVVYAAFGLAGGGIRIMKTETAGASWTRVTPPLAEAVQALTYFGRRAGDDDFHVHELTIAAAGLAPPFSGTYEFTTGPALFADGSSDAHTHTVTFSSQQMEQLAIGEPVHDDTAETEGHTHHIGLSRSFGGQNTYNLVIGVDPNDADVVFYGEQRLWKTTTGDAPWTDMTDGEPSSPPGRPYGTHVDQHAILFDPLVRDTVWLGNDGGVYVSTDGGRIWSHANRDLATLQYNSVASDPDWEAVLLGGTQDNGTHRFLGHPAWMFSIGGDGGFTAIDVTPRDQNPPAPPRMYRGYISTVFARSDDAGEPPSWRDKPGPRRPALFYPPFELDAGNPSVCYFGARDLWRSDNRGEAESWVQVTRDDDLDSLISAIAVAGPRLLYVGTAAGSVYRIGRTGPTWDRDAEHVTITRLSGGDDFSGRFVSDLAIDAYFNLWATISGLPAADANGVVTSNDFVYRWTYFPEESGRRWQSRSRGLPPAHPVLSIAIDPANEAGDVLFCGGDMAVFRTDDAGGCWVPWDEGLPNAPVTHLDIHNRSRLIRAATYGRSVWERPIDAWMTRDADLYVRDNVLDTGRETPSPAGVPHPFRPTTSVHWWQSPDLKVDIAAPDFQTAQPVDEYLGFEALADMGTQGAARHRVYAQVHNRGPQDATNVKVRVFASDVQFPPLPATFWSGGRPFSGDVGPDWRPVGDARVFAALSPGEPGVVSWDWTLGSERAGKYSLLALVTCDQDPLQAADIFDVEILARERRQAALKNVVLVAGTDRPIEKPFILLQLYFPERYIHVIPRDFMIDWGNLPRGSRIDIAFEGEPKEAVLDATAKDLRKSGITVRGKRPAGLEAALKEHRVRRSEFGARTYTLVRNRQRLSLLPGVAVPTGRPFRVALLVDVPRAARAKTAVFQFDLMRMGIKGLVGTTCVIPTREKGQP